MSGESKINNKLQEIWHPTQFWCYFVALVLKTALPREQGIVPDILRIIREMLSREKANSLRSFPARWARRARRRLNLNRNEITDAQAKKVAEMLPSSKMTSLWLNHNQITDDGLIKLAEMLPSSKLTKLWLNDNQITDAGAIKLAEMLPSSKLIVLYLEDNQITDAGQKTLTNIKNKDDKEILISFIFAI